MRDALGGAVNIIIIVVFIVIVLGYLAFNVNYTKAFRMKDKIISIYNQYDGNCNSNCRSEISAYERTIGYNPANMMCPTDYTRIDNSYCVKKNVVNSSKDSQYEGKERYYYSIITKINIEIPVIQNTLNLSVFQVTGNTKTYES